MKNRIKKTSHAINHSASLRCALSFVILLTAALIVVQALDAQPALTSSASSHAGGKNISDGPSIVVEPLKQEKTTPAPGPVITAQSVGVTPNHDASVNGVIAPGSPMTVNLCLENIGAVKASNVVVELKSTSKIISLGEPQKYGTIRADGSSTCMPFSFTLSPSADVNSAVTLKLEVRDETTNLGEISYSFTPNAPQAICAENFDAVTPPNLPTGWTATTAIDCAGTPNSDPWVTSNAGTPAPPADTPPNAAFVNDPNCISDERLDSPLFNVTSATATVTFRRNNNLENGFDGCVLEISVNGSAFQDIIAAGGSFAVGGYNGVISVNFGSPIAGRNAWTGNTAGFVTTTVNLPAAANGGIAVLRWRRGTDSSVSGQGIRIDSLTSTDTDCIIATCEGITCPANITQPNDTNQCGAVVNYPPPSTSGVCVPPTCSPASGSFFPVGTTTVNCMTGPPAQMCSFTVTVVDTQAPNITCPTPVTAVAPASCPIATSVLATFPPPPATDNCPGVTVACVPPSGSCVPIGTTTVTCTTTDAAGNTATCTFSFAAFNVCLQDDNKARNVVLINTQTGQYRFSCDSDSEIFTGIGTIDNNPGSCLFSLTHNAQDRRVRATWSTSSMSGDASLQSPPGTVACDVQDREPDEQWVRLWTWLRRRRSLQLDCLPGKHHTDQRSGPVRRSCQLPACNYQRTMRGPDLQPCFRLVLPAWHDYCYLQYDRTACTNMQLYDNDSHLPG